MQCSTFTNVYWDLNIKNCAANGGPLNRGASCHDITGILVNLALSTMFSKCYYFALSFGICHLCLYITVRYGDVR